MCHRAPSLQSLFRWAPTLQSRCGALHEAWPRGTACRIRALRYISPGLLENPANFSFQGWVYLPQTFLVQSTSLHTESTGYHLSQGTLSCQRGPHSELVLLKSYLPQVIGLKEKSRKMEEQQHHKQKPGCWAGQSV